MRHTVRVRLSKSRRLAFAAALAILATILVQSPPAPKSRASQTGPLALPDQYQADFSNGATKGIGLRFAHLSTGLGVDLRLKGFPGRDATKKGKDATFAAAQGIRLSYQVSANLVKETIVLDQTSPSEFRFGLNAPGLVARTEGDEILLSPPRQPFMFKLNKVVAWDANGAKIPASLLLKDEQVVVRLDKDALAKARPPIVVDPTIEGAPSDATVDNEARRLFQTTDGRWVFFHRMVTADGPKFVLRISSDQGSTWGDPQPFADAGASGDISALKLEDDTFLVIYNSGTPDLPRVAFKKLTSQGTTWQAGLESVVSTGAVWWTPRPTIADRGEGPLGRRLVAGFISYNSLLNRWDYLTAFSENSGVSWLTGGTCGPGGGTVTSQGERALCVSVQWGGLYFSEWNGAAWQTRPQIDSCCQWALPSIAKTDDGSLHLVGENNQSVSYTKLSPGSIQWTPMTWFGPGKAPTISTTGTSLHIFAYDPQSSNESLIRTWVATDGVNWLEGTPLGGKPLTYVLDENQSYDFLDRPAEGDALFSLSDATSWVGNRIGTSSVLHRLDSGSKRLAFKFEVPQGGADVSRIRLWMTASSAPAYRVGLKGPDSTGTNPSEDWLTTLVGGVEVPAKSSVVVSDRVTAAAVDVDIPTTRLDPAQIQRAFVVVEPVCQSTVDLTDSGSPCTPTKVPTANQWVEVQGIGADPEASFPYDVRTNAGASWSTALGEVPHMVLSGSSGTIFSQEITPGPWQYGEMEYVIGGESLVAPRDMSLTQVRVHLIKIGNPSEITIRLFDATNNELWSAPANPASSGWVSLPVSGVGLTRGSRYRLLADHRGRDSQNAWMILPTGVGGVSFDGNTSALTYSHSRKGISDRSAEASDRQTNPWFWDFVAFDTSAQDALYLGDTQPFDFVSLVRQVTDWGQAIPTSFSYWNGTSWAPLTMNRNDFLAGGFSGDAEFTPPSDWAQRTLEGKGAYWVRLTTAVGAPTRAVVDRTTGMRDLRFPSAADSGISYIPLAEVRLNRPGRTVEFARYDAVPPKIWPSTLVPLDGGNTVFLNQPLQVKIWDADSGIGPRVTFSLSDATTGALELYPSIAYDAVTKWATTDAVNLSPGHLYRIGVTASDYAGNSTSVVQTSRGFLATNLDLSRAATQARIDASSCSLSAEANPETGMKVATCPIHVWLAASQVSLGGSHHEGLGFVDQEVPLQSVRVLVSATGEQQVIDPGWASLRVPQPFQVVAPATELLVLSTRELATRVGILSLPVPGNSDSAAVSEALVSTHPGLAACSNVTFPIATCLPDPVWHMGDLLQEVALVDSVCIDLEHVHVIFRCTGEEVASFFPGAVKIAEDISEVTNELVDGLIAGTTTMSSYEPTSASFPYFWEVWQTPPSFISSSGFEDWLVSDDGPINWIPGLKVRLICGWFNHPQPDHSADWSDWISNSTPSAWLQGHGFHMTTEYAANNIGTELDWTRHQTYEPRYCGNDTFRDHARSRPNSYEIQDYVASVPDGEPNPEVMPFAHHGWPWPYEEWPIYVRWWHDNVP